MFAAEAVAVIHGLELAIVMGFHLVILEGDSTSVIKKIQVNEVDFSKIGALTCEARRLVTSFWSCSFWWVDREGNRAAYELARFGSRNTGDKFWVKEVPAVVAFVIEKDHRCVDPPKSRKGGSFRGNLLLQTLGFFSHFLYSLSQVHLGRRWFVGLFLF